MNPDLYIPLSDAEFAELDRLLDRYPDSCAIEELDGLFCALIVGPQTIAASEWLPVVLGDKEVEDISEEDTRRVFELLLRHWNKVESGFRENWSGLSAAEGSEKMYFPFLDDPTESGCPLAEGWARGFRDGADWMEEHYWDALEQDEECVAIMNLIAAFDTGEKSPGNPLTEQERDEAISLVVAGLQYIYVFWLRYMRVMNAPRTPARADDTPGRNEDCPCGSGKKFKKCCGSPEKLH